MADPAARGTVVFVLKGYPRLSETFIAQEILGLERRGLRLSIVALRRPTDALRHPVHDSIAAPVDWLPEYLHRAPLRIWRAWRRARRRPGYRRARAVWLRDLRRDPTRNRVRRFGQALVLAASLPPDAVRLHAHFLHTPASVVRYAALLAGLPWSGSAHAKDIWTTPDWDLAEKLATAEWIAVCTGAGQDRLRALAARPGSVELIPHGLDLGRFPPPATARPPRDGTDPGDPVRLLSVGRAVEKKGFDILLDALADLPPGTAWHWTHVGGGALLAELERRAAALGLGDHIAWRGPQAQEAILAAYRTADLFVLPCRIAADGDRDGLPNVLMEAASQRLAILSTPVSGIPELIGDGTHGLLVSPGDPAALAGALVRLIGDPALRERLATAAEARVRRDFGHEAGLDRLAARFGLTSAPAAPAAKAAE